MAIGNHKIYFVTHSNWGSSIAPLLKMNGAKTLVVNFIKIPQNNLIQNYVVLWDILILHVLGQELQDIYDRDSR